MVLFILHSLSARRKAAEALFCSKIKTGCFTEELMELVFGAHAKVRVCEGVCVCVCVCVCVRGCEGVSACTAPPPLNQALREFFPSILALCENLLCSPSPTISNFAISLYQNLFTSFDTYCQQVHLLYTHNYIYIGIAISTAHLTANINAAKIAGSHNYYACHHRRRW